MMPTIAPTVSGRPNPSSMRQIWARLYRPAPPMPCRARPTILVEDHVRKVTNESGHFQLLVTYSCIMFFASIHITENPAKNVHATISMLRRP